jgi:hypothetical protein
MNKMIFFTMLTLLLTFCKWYFSRVCDKILVDYSFIKHCFLAFILSCLVMPYSNWRRHNPPSIPQTPYQTLIIPCPSFDPIYQVILLENSNELNLSPAQRRILEKKRCKDWKAKEVKPHMKSSMFQKGEKKKKDEICKLSGEILLKESKKGDHTFL